MGAILFLVIALWLVIQTPWAQNWLIKQVTERLSSDLQTRIDIKHVDFSLFNNMHLQDVLVEDRQKDTILSAGEITVKITDWFFLKKNIELKYIGLRDAYIHLQRTDAVWRHQFLLDYFATPASTSPKKSKAINLAFKDVDLKNIRLKQEDRWRGEDITVSLASLKTDPRFIDFDKKIIDINALDINQPYVAFLQYDGNRPANYRKNHPQKAATDINEQQWTIKASNISILNGTFKHDNGTEAPESYFDGQHIEFAKVYANLKNAKWANDTVTAHINISTRERSGFEVKHLIADAKVTPQEMRFENLDLRTNDSYIKNFFSMKFSDFSEMSDFVHKVHMEAHFAGTDLNSDDIAYFAPALRSWKKHIYLSGNVTGPVSALAGNNLYVEAGSQTYFQGSAQLTGLPDIQSTFMDITAKDFRTVYSDVLAFVPAVKQITTPNLAKLQYVRFNGNYAGFLKDFVTNGTIQTALGTITTDVNMKLPSGAAPVYSGTVATRDFNIGAFLDEAALGHVSMTAKLKGAGFSTGGSNIALESDIKYIDYNNYRYQNIKADGQLNKKLFNGKLKVNDPNATLTLNGLVDYTQKTPRFNFSSDIQQINFNALHFTKEKLTLTGNINTDFSGNNIDNFLGTANISHATLVKDSIPLSFDSLALSSRLVDGQKYLTAISNEFTAQLAGTFNIRELPNSVKSFLTRYYPAYIKAPAQAPKNQNFSFDIQTRRVDDYISLIDSSLTGFNNSHVFGSINTLTNSLSLTGDIPYFKYDNYGISGIHLTAIGNYESIATDITSTNINIGDSLSIPNTNINVRAQNDVSDVYINTGSGNLQQAQLNAIVKTYYNGVRIEFKPSTFIINNKTWSIDKDGELEFRSNVPAQGQLVLHESTQEIRVHTQPSDIGSWNDIVVQVKNYNLGDISPFILPDNRLEGLADGNIIVENPGRNMKITTQDFMGRGIRFDNDSIGDISARALFDMATKELTVNGKILNPQQKDMAFDIHLFLKDKQSQLNNTIALNANNFKISHLSRFLGTLFSDIDGEITGNFNVNGPFNALTVSGKGRLHNAGLRVLFTQCYYKIEDNDIELTEDEIRLGRMVLKDTITGNPVYVSGNIQHNSFRDMFFDVTVSTRKPGTRDPGNNKPVQVLNTTYKDNKVFYGNVKATGSFALVGSQNNTYMNIDAIATDDYESSFTIASVNSKAGQMPDWLVEKKHGKDMTGNGSNDDASNMSYDLNVTTNPKVQMRFVIDEVTGDEIKGRASGRLAIHGGSSEALTIKNRLDLQEGSYNYTFKSFFPKPFELKKGGDNYISWTGDPVNADINFEAQYKAERVSFAPLAGFSIDQSYSNTRENVYVVAHLTDKLFKPRFNFSVELDPNSKYKNDFNVTSALQQISNDNSTNNNEITRQVTYLIVFNSFAPPESNTTNLGLGTAVNELTYNTISSLSGLFFNEVNRKINSQLRKLFGSNLSLSFGGSVYNRNLLNAGSSGFDLNQANVNGRLAYTFSDRLELSVGSSLEVPLQQSIQQTVQFLPDVTFGWQINKSGTIKLNIFYRENLDYLTTSSTGAAKLKRTGGGISFRKEFDNLHELFNNVRKNTRRELRRTNNMAPPKDSSGKVNGE